MFQTTNQITYKDIISLHQLLKPLEDVYLHFSVSIALPLKPGYFGFLRIAKTFRCLHVAAFFLWKPCQKESLYFP